MCFWRCQLVGKIRDGRLIKLEGNPKSIDNGVSLCARGNAGVAYLYDPDRLKYPLKNVGKRGAPKWQRISWEEALDTCASKLKTIVDRDGAKGLCFFGHGYHSKSLMDFLERTVGTPNVSEASFFQCRGVRDTAYLTTLEIAPDENVDMANAKVIFLTGMHIGENIHLSHVKNYLRGLERGAKLVVVDPRYSASAAKSHIWVPIRPGTDTYAAGDHELPDPKTRSTTSTLSTSTVKGSEPRASRWTAKAAAECIAGGQIKGDTAANMPHQPIPWPTHLRGAPTSSADF